LTTHQAEARHRLRVTAAATSDLRRVCRTARGEQLADTAVIAVRTMTDLALVAVL
jgi:hypothetical protein